MENNNMLRINICQMIEDNRPSGCGYCKDKITNIRKQTSYKYRLILKSISVDFYEKMFKKGWTRCGDLVYKTIYEKTCCKLYQPRININNFKLNNEQTKIMKRFRKFLSGEYEQNKLKIAEKNLKNSIKTEDNYQKQIFLKVKDYINSKVYIDILKKYVQNEKDIEIILNKINNDTKIRRNTNKKYNFDYSCDLIFIIIKMINSLSKKNQINQINQIINVEDDKNKNKDLIKILYNNFIQYYKPINEIVNFNEETGHINFQIKNQEEYKKYLNYIENGEKNILTNQLNNNNLYNDIYNINNINNNNLYNDIYNINNMNNPNNMNNHINYNYYFNNNIEINNFKNEVKEINIKSKKEKKKEETKKEKYIFDYFPEIVNEPEIYLPLKHKYTIELSDKISLIPTEERFLLYNKYQRAVHNENSSILTYNNNWGLSILEKNKKIPLPENLSQKTKHPELYPQYYGTYNLIHRIDGKIIAVTVIDLLPNSVESVYCYYDPDFSFLDLGVFTVIREIEYMKSFQNLIDKNMTYYSMGEMCQSCQKLKYKGNYIPTEIMDHYTGKYVLLTDEVKKLIADNKCHHLVENMNNPEIKLFSDIEIEDKYWNFMIDVFGEKVFIDDFFNLYVQNENYSNILSSCIRRFLEIIDADLYSNIEFYFDGSVLNNMNI